MLSWYQRLIVASHKYSYVGLNIEGDLRSKIIDFAKNEVSDDDLGEDGRELNPHVTVFYGLHTDSPERVKDLLKDAGPFEITFGVINRFTKNEDFDVLKIQVESDYLRQLHSKLKKLDHTLTHPVYQPHCTLAYLKKGACMDHVGNSLFEGEKFKVQQLEFSSKQKHKTKIPLKGKFND